MEHTAIGNEVVRVDVEAPMLRKGVLCVANVYHRSCSEVHGHQRQKRSRQRSSTKCDDSANQTA